MSDIETVGTALPKEMARVRDNIIPVYQTIPTGAFATIMMRRDLDNAARAMAEGDVVGMIAALEALKEYKL